MKIATQTKEKYANFSSDQLIDTIASLEATIESYKTLLFSKKSERRVEDPIGIKNLFDPAEVPDSEPGDEENEDETDSTPVKGHTRKRGKRKKLPADLPRERVFHDLDAKDKFCQIHGVELEKIGETTTEQLEIIPAKLKVIENVCPSYKCPCCSKENETVEIFKGKEPPRIIPKSLVSPSLLAYIITAKYQDGLPLYRQEKIFDRYGIDLGRASMARWVMEAASRAIPLINLMNEDLMSRRPLGSMRPQSKF